MKNLPLPPPIVATAKVYQSGSYSPDHSKIFEAVSSLDLEIQISSYLLSNEMAVLTMHRGDYPEMLAYPSDKTGKHVYFRDVRPTNIGLAA